MSSTRSILVIAIDYTFATGDSINKNTLSDNFFHHLPQIFIGNNALIWP